MNAGNKNHYVRASKTAQWVKVLVAKPGDLSSIPGFPDMEGDRCLLVVL